MSRGPDAGTRLARAIERAWPGAVIPARDSAPWVSVTFAGARHRMSLTLPDCPGCDAWIEHLPEAEFAIPGHLLADLRVIGVERRHGSLAVTLEALTVEA